MTGVKIRDADRWKHRRKAVPFLAPAIDYRLVYETRLKLIRGNYAGDSEEPRLRAIEHTVNVYCSNNGCDLETAKAAVLAALKTPPGGGGCCGNRRSACRQESGRRA